MAVASHGNTICCSASDRCPIHHGVAPHHGIHDYLKGIAPPHVRLTQIFAGVMPFLLMVFISMALVYVVPKLVFHLLEVFYGR
jgi:TRAP-type mannitol/chloroaromatic compound transport system permease large subunit